MSKQLCKYFSVLLSSCASKTMPSFSKISKVFAIVAQKKQLTKNPGLSFLNKQWFSAGRINLNTWRDAFLRDAQFWSLYTTPQRQPLSWRWGRQFEKKCGTCHFCSRATNRERAQAVRSLARATTAICYFTIPRTPVRFRFPFLTPSFHPLRTDTGRLLLLLLHHVKQFGATLSMPRGRAAA